MKYLGQKSFYSKTTLPARKDGSIRTGFVREYKNVLRFPDGKVVVSKQDKAKARKAGIKATRTAYDVGYVESKWRTYWGSSEIAKLATPVSKEIVEFALSKRNLTYLEAKHLFINDVIKEPEFYNENILGKFFKEDV